jgi:hypothetical protein
VEKNNCFNRRFISFRGVGGGGGCWFNKCVKGKMLKTQLLSCLWTISDQGSSSPSSGMVDSLSYVTTYSAGFLTTPNTLFSISFLCCFHLSFIFIFRFSISSALSHSFTNWLKGISFSCSL